MTDRPAERSAGLDVLSRYTLRADAPAAVKLQHAALAADALADTAPELSARRGRGRPGRKVVAAIIAAGIAGIAILQPLPTALVFVTIMIVAYATTLAHRVWQPAEPGVALEQARAAGRIDPQPGDGSPRIFACAGRSPPFTFCSADPITRS